MKPLDRREFLLAASGLALGDPHAEAILRARISGGRQVAEGPDGRVALTYLTSKPEGSNLRANSACCFHPVTTPSGRAADRPGARRSRPPPRHLPGLALDRLQAEGRLQQDGADAADAWLRHRARGLLGLGRVRADRSTGHPQPRCAAGEGDRTPRRSSPSATTGRSAAIATPTSRRRRSMAGQRDDANVLDLTYGLTPDWDMTLNQTPFGGFCVRARNDGES